jgi:hypothetical protein
VVPTSSFLRRHYPDQVQTVGGDQPPSQPGPPGSRILNRSAARLPGAFAAGASG